ncbi:O-antigen/teichoic acid export membrane protein [Neolewinella xylanilytica]|uniref:O-antigen/teichoic acid export membrane protein n=1 Tax=Neolewinella xylanilytica TaxID=1514080 RepID=A0A2S6I7Q8_9BACT|nr:polysaccharide biosynthesis protein [Neolewinella xylanilytica]PPK87532.1 O-antigen/teichoic acid export membrane protein [Neolewinella xylanilytica]
MQRLDKLAAASPRLFKWGKLLGVTGGAQLLIQATGFICGIFIIRILSSEQYAYYTLANTMLGTMTVLADGGISTGVMSLGGKKWKSREELGKILATGMHMRRQFAIGSLLVSLPILFFLLQQQGMIWWHSVLLILCLTPTFWAALSGSLLQVVPKLHQDVNDLLKINVGINISRVLLTIPFVFFFPFAGIAILATGASQVMGNLQLRKLSLSKADWKADSDPGYRAQIMGTVKRILPGSIYYCISGQITVWLVAIFGSTESIANLGAIGRLMVILTLVKMVVDTLITPRYARLASKKRLVISRFFQILALVAILCSVIVGGVYLFPDEFLWILGDKYADLEYEVFLMTISSCLSLLSGTAHNLSTSRGVIPNPYLFIGTTIASQVILLAFVVDYSSLAGVIMFSIYGSLINLAYRFIDFLYRTLVKIEWSTDEQPLP